jgi:hypothetical protein
VEDVLEELKENNIDARQLVDWPANHCQWAEYSSEEERSE